MPNASQPQIKNLVWIDCEMTGPMVSKDHIMEIAILVTDLDLNILDEKGFRVAIKLSEEEITRLAPWVQEHMGESGNGLIEECRNSKVELRDAEKMAIEYLSKYIEPKTAPLCGNTISFDRGFLNKDMLELTRFLHHRNIDVSTLKLLYNTYTKGKPFAKKETHKAMDDILESIEEFRFYYKSFLNI